MAQTNSVNINNLDPIFNSGGQSKSKNQNKQQQPDQLQEKIFQNNEFNNNIANDSDKSQKLYTYKNIKENKLDIGALNSFLSECASYDSGYMYNKDSFCYKLLNLFSQVSNSIDFNTILRFIYKPSLQGLETFTKDKEINFKILSDFVYSYENFYINKIEMFIKKTIMDTNTNYSINSLFLNNSKVYNVKIFRKQVLKPKIDLYSLEKTDNFSTFLEFIKYYKTKVKEKFINNFDNPITFPQVLYNRIKNINSYSDYLFDDANNINSYLTDIYNIGQTTINDIPIIIPDVDNFIYEISSEIYYINKGYLINETNIINNFENIVMTFDRGFICNELTSFEDIIKYCISKKIIINLFDRTPSVNNAKKVDTFISHTHELKITIDSLYNELLNSKKFKQK